jgi:hypothetical protein
MLDEPLIALVNMVLTSPSWQDLTINRHNTSQLGIFGMDIMSYFKNRLVRAQFDFVLI